MHTPAFLPHDLTTGTLLTRIWNPAGPGGPSVAVVRADGLYDLSSHVPTMSTLLEAAQPARLVQGYAGVRVGSLEEVLANSTEAGRDERKPFFLSPCVLPLIPAYLSFMTGLTTAELAGSDRDTVSVMVPALLFVAGFSLVFVGLGASASVLGPVLAVRLCTGSFNSLNSTSWSCRGEAMFSVCPARV